MLLGKKRLNKKMFTIFKHLYEIIFSNNNNNKMDIIIEKGHYQEKSSLNSDKSIIIRILGPDINKEGYWVTADGNSIPEYIIQENYVLLDTSPTESKQNKIKNKNIFKDFDKIKKPNDFNDGINENLSSIETLNTTKNIQPIIDKFIQQTTIEQNFNFDTELIEKLNIDKLNKLNFEKFGENKFNKQKIKFEIELEFNYDINKIKQTCELLDLDILSITKYLVSKTNKDFERIIEEKISEYLTKQETIETPISKETIIEPIIESQKVEIPIIEQNETKSEDLVELGIINIDNFIKNLK